MVRSEINLAQFDAKSLRWPGWEAQVHAVGSSVVVVVGSSVVTSAEVGWAVVEVVDSAVIEAAVFGWAVVDGSSVVTAAVDGSGDPSICWFG